MHSTYNEGKSVVGERFIRTLKNKLHRHMTAINKNIVNEYNNTTHNTIKMKPKDVKDDTTKSSAFARNKSIY